MESMSLMLFGWSLGFSGGGGGRYSAMLLSLMLQGAYLVCGNIFGGKASETHPFHLTSGLHKMANQLPCGILQSNGVIGLHNWLRSMKTIRRPTNLAKSQDIFPCDLSVREKTIMNLLPMYLWGLK